MLVRRLRYFAPLAFMAAIGCGDIGRMVVDVNFASEDLELRTRGLEIVVRAAGPVFGCENLWGNPGERGLELRNFLAYPNRVDVRASPVDLDMYPELTVFVYAHPTTDVDDEGNPASAPIAGGCTLHVVDPAVSTSLTVELEAAP